MLYKAIVKDLILFMQTTLTVRSSSLREAELKIEREYPNYRIISLEEAVVDENSVN